MLFTKFEFNQVLAFFALRMGLSELEHSPTIVKCIVSDNSHSQNLALTASDLNARKLYFLINVNLILGSK